MLLCWSRRGDERRGTYLVDAFTHRKRKTYLTLSAALGLAELMDPPALGNLMLSPSGISRAYSPVALGELIRGQRRIRTAYRPAVLAELMLARSGISPAYGGAGASIN